MKREKEKKKRIHLTYKVGDIVKVAHHSFADNYVGYDIGVVESSEQFTNTVIKYRYRIKRFVRSYNWQPMKEVPQQVGKMSSFTSNNTRYPFLLSIKKQLDETE